MTPIINEICDEVLTAEDIEYVRDVDEFIVWCQVLKGQIIHEKLWFDFPHFKLYSCDNGAKYYWPYIQRKRDA